ncbi:protein-S-isoprenylcysteine O-methyltransferase [Cladorrhinum sp. PSN259]|nr:protein-S-isoprenylcysteine O-methyltransferase [Cladorrhinum sp. PSN259]
MPSFAQTSLAITILASYIGTYLASTPPNPNPSPTTAATPTSDSLRSWHIAEKHGTKIFMAPLGLFSLHSALLAYHYPSIPKSLLRHGVANGLNINRITWSKATVIPLALILCVGIPLRLISYSALGKNFTFALAKPDRLTTTGIYQWVQHPSYTGVVVLILANSALLGTCDGIWSCWMPPKLFRMLKGSVLAPLGVAFMLWGVWTRVKEEEGMLKEEFGPVWEEWHGRTARFVPGIF